VKTIPQWSKFETSLQVKMNIF